MASASGNEDDLYDKTYDNLMEEAENMKARMMPLLNEINENRARIKELHAEYAVKLGDIVLLKNSLEETSEKYDCLAASINSNKDAVMNMIAEGTESWRLGM